MRRNLFGRASRTRREQSIRLKISRIDFDLTELENSQVWSGPPKPVVEFRTGARAQPEREAPRLWGRRPPCPLGRDGPLPRGARARRVPVPARGAPVLIRSSLFLSRARPWAYAPAYAQPPRDGPTRRLSYRVRRPFLGLAAAAEGGRGGTEASPAARSFRSRTAPISAGPAPAHNLF